MLGWVSQEQKKMNYIRNIKEEQNNNQMGKITGTLIVELAWNTQKRIQDRDLGCKDTLALLGIGIKIETFSKLQVRNKMKELLIWNKK